MASTDKAAVALQERQFVGERSSEGSGKVMRRLGKRRHSEPEFLGQVVVIARQRRRDPVRRVEAVADRGEIARAAAVQREAR